MLSLSENLLLGLSVINRQLTDLAGSSEFRPSSAAKMDEPIHPKREMGRKENHAVKIQDILYQQFVSESEFCDVTLLVGDEKVQAHWCILVSCPFFQSLHDSGMKESSEVKIRLNYGTPWAMKEALKFLYLGTISVTYDKIKELLEAAEYLQITDLKKCCNDYLYMIDINEENCVQLSLLSSLYDLDLYNSAFQYLRGHLPTVLKGEDALTLTKESVMSLINDETLTYVSQETFLEFIIKWTEQDVEFRSESFKELFLALNLKNIPKSVLIDCVEKNSVISRHIECKDKVLNLLSELESGALTECRATKDVILLCGGSGQGLYIGHFLFQQSSYLSLNTLFGYVVDEKRWTKFAPMPSPIQQPLMVCDNNGCLYIYDKNHTMEINNLVYVYNTAEKVWTSLKVALPENAENINIHGMIHCQNKLFFLSSAMISKSERASASRTWQCFLMEVSKETGETAVKAYFFPRNIKTQVYANTIGDRYICVIGSKLGTAKPRQNTTHCVCYDIHTDKIKKISRGCNTDQHIFDYNGGIMTAMPGKVNTKVYNFDSKTWDLRRDLAIPLPFEQSSRTDYSFIMHHNKFYVFGGKVREGDKSDPIQGALVYSHETKTWDKLDDVPDAAFGSGICVGKLPSAAVQCHVKCPHCVFKSPRSQATYNVTRTGMDSEDDEDDHEYSMGSSYNDYFDQSDEMSFFGDEDDDFMLDPDDLWFY